MDILTHSLSGIAVGTVISSFSKTGIKEKLGIIVISAIGGAIPDIDAISLWSEFDSTFGKIFNLSNTGKEIYSSKFWYSHHGFMHSVFAGILFSLILLFIFYIIQKMMKKKSSLNIFSTLKSYFLALLSFFTGFIIHLFEDMPTPASAWGGVNLFWPSKIYIGGTGDIWWWNNYDIFLIVLLAIFLNVIILLFGKYLKSKVLTSSVFIIALLFCIFQIKTRESNFNQLEKQSDFQSCEQWSKEIQNKMLGGKLYCLMVKFDNQIPVNF